MTTSQHDVFLGKATPPICHRIAAGRGAREAAFRLVYRSYLRAGLGQPNAHRLRVTPYHLLPTTEVFLATLRGQAILTMSLVIDGALGLPMESVYGREVARRRAAGRRLAEVTCLADRRGRFVRFFPLFLEMGRLLAQYARSQGVDELVLAVHPKHARFYERFLAFRQIGGQRAYPAVRNRPAIALGLDLADSVEHRRQPQYDTFFGRRLPGSQLRPQPITPAEQDYFAPMIDRGFQLPPLGDVSSWRDEET